MNHSDEKDHAIVTIRQRETESEDGDEDRDTVRTNRRPKPHLWNHSHQS